MGYPMWALHGIHLGAMCASNIWAEYGLSHVGIAWDSPGCNVGHKYMGRIYMGYIWAHMGPTCSPDSKISGTHMGKMWASPYGPEYGDHLGHRWDTSIWAELLIIITNDYY